MGSSSSKPASQPPPHVWKGSVPTNMSQNMADQLQSSPETDTSRAQIVELQIQARVAEELKRLQDLGAARLREAQEKLSAEPAGEDGGQPQQQLSSRAVSKEVEALRAKLEGRKKARALPEAVETARADVVRCLRENDRRPLDCWREVERFKEEVRRLEGAWVDKVVS